MDSPQKVKVGGTDGASCVICFRGIHTGLLPDKTKKGGKNERPGPP
jgi:hypothetical protein